MAKQVSINYFFIFNKADDGWQNVRDFEKDLADFFGAHGFDAEVVQTIEGSASRMIMLKRIDPTMFLTNTKGVNIPAQMPKVTNIKSNKIISKMVSQINKFKTK